MPSPVGHALAGIAVGWAVDGRRPAVTRAALLTAGAYAMVAALPDLDLLMRTHRGPSHGIGTAVIAGLVGWALTRRVRTGAAVALAYASHILLDWFGTDTTPPIGLMALWPFSREYYESQYHIFMAVSRRYWLPEFWTYNLLVLMRELLILLPLVWIAGLLRTRGGRGTAAVVACALLSGTAVPGVRAQDQNSYAHAVGKYRAGEFEAAVKAVSAMSVSKIEEERRLFERTPFGTLRDEDVTAAILLHTEAHFDSATGRIEYLPTPHLDRARRLARRCLELLGAAPTDLGAADRRARGSLERIEARQFVRGWYLLVVSQFHGLRQVSRSGHYLQEARFLFPDDPDILLASGSHHEMLTFTGDRVPLFDDKGDKIRDEVIDRKKERAEASMYFRAALAANPGLYEAQLRLGRTLHVLGDLEAAARELEATRTRAPQGPLKYLAALFLALVLEDRGERHRAADVYADAINTYPRTQASFVGLSELLYGDGQPDRAAETMKRLLDTPAESDPWWSYMMGEWWHFDARLAGLRRQVRP